MFRFLSYKTFLIPVLVLFQGPALQAQESTPEGVTPAGGTSILRREACRCGRWTCPSCQQRFFCPPTLPSAPLQAPGMYPSPMAPSPGAEQPGMPDTTPGDTLPPELPDISQTTPDLSNLFAANTAATGGAFGSSLLGATTPEMIGDFFGPGALPSIVAQSFLIDTANVQDIGGGILALELDGDSPPNDFFSLAPATVNPDGSQTIALGAPNDPSDVQQPAGSGFSYLSGSATQALNTSTWVGQYGYGKPIIVPGAGYVLGRLKVAENYSPVPRDRFFFNYSLFHNVPLAENGISVNRFTPGFEKTFLDGLASVELRTPFGATLSSDILIDGGTDTGHVEFGNMFTALKFLLLERRNWLMAGGLSVTVPTADDTRVLASDGTELLRIENEAVHVMPFLGLAVAPTQRFFAQGTMQVDVDVNGSTVLANSGNALRPIGKLHDFTYLYIDTSFGYWLHRAAPNCGHRLITGVAPIVELHMNRSLNDGDSASDGLTLVRNPIQEFDNTNILGGVILNIRDRSRLAAGYATPIGNGSDRVFDGEFRVTLNRYF